jgi:hypothetical protein
MRKIFYYFPYKRHPCILYADSSLFSTKIFSVLYNKIGFGSVKLRLRCNVYLSKLFELINRGYEDVPDNRVEMIYDGFDNKIYFVFNAEGGVSEVYVKDRSKSSSLIKKKKFLGYPVYYDKTCSMIENEKPLRNFLKNHWSSLKNGTSKLHGDLVPFNVLIDDKNKVHLIDSRKRVTNSLISDHFYFYAFFLDMIKKQKPYSASNYQNIQQTLDNMYLYIFKGENKAFLTKLVSQIKINEFYLRSSQDSLNAFKKLMQRVR